MLGASVAAVSRFAAILQVAVVVEAGSGDWNRKIEKRCVDEGIDDDLISLRGRSMHREMGRADYGDSKPLPKMRSDAITAVPNSEASFAEASRIEPVTA